MWNGQRYVYRGRPSLIPRPSPLSAWRVCCSCRQLCAGKAWSETSREVDMWAGGGGEWHQTNAAALTLPSPSTLTSWCQCTSYTPYVRPLKGSLVPRPRPLPRVRATWQRESSVRINRRTVERNVEMNRCTLVSRAGRGNVWSLLPAFHVAMKCH